MSKATRGDGCQPRAAIRYGKCREPRIVPPRPLVSPFCWANPRYHRQIRSMLRTGSHFRCRRPQTSGSSKFSPLVLPTMSEMQSRRRSTGYTLLEVLIVMSVVAILAAIAVPSFKYVTTSYRISAEVNALLGDMQFARSVALKQGQWVTICASTTGTSCVGSGKAWNTGWIVFLDSNQNQTVGANAVIRTQPAFTGTDTFNASTATFWYLTYAPGGYAPTGLAAAIALNLHDSSNNALYTRCLQVTQMGTPTAAKGNPPCT